MKKTVIFIPVATRTLANMLGDNAREELNDLIALYELIDKREDTIRGNKEDDYLLSWIEINNLYEVTTDAEDCFPIYYSYSKWFKEVFIKDYDKALIEAAQIPSDRELCILRIAREAVYKNIDFKTMYKFCREYLVNDAEFTIFCVEYYNCKHSTNSSTGGVK